MPSKHFQSQDGTTHFSFKKEGGSACRVWCDTYHTCFGSVWRIGNVWKAEVKSFGREHINEIIAGLGGMKTPPNMLETDFKSRKAAAAVLVELALKEYKIFKQAPIKLITWDWYWGSMHHNDEWKQRIEYSEYHQEWRLMFRNNSGWYVLAFGQSREALQELLDSEVEMTDQSIHMDKMVAVKHLREYYGWNEATEQELLASKGHCGLCIKKGYVEKITMCYNKN